MAIQAEPLIGMLVRQTIIRKPLHVKVAALYCVTPLFNFSGWTVAPLLIILKMNQRHVAGFIAKLNSLLQDPSLEQVIYWKDPEIVIKNKQLFMEDVLPRHFRHCRFESFIRQLNLYGFHKVSKTDKTCFCFKHQHFRLGDLERLKLIQLRSKLSKDENVKIEEESPKEINMRRLGDLDFNRTSLKNTLCQVNGRIRKLMRETPGLETELKEALALIRLCQGRDEHLGFVPVASPFSTKFHSPGSTLPSVFSFDSRFSLC